VTKNSDEIKNVEASVRARLANVAKAQDADFGFILRLYFLERFLYRLGASRYRDGFLLKGALLFFARADEDTRPFARPTRDIDLEALAMGPDFDELKSVFQLVARVASPEDGVRFDPESIAIEAIREDDRYGGVRVHIDAYLGKAHDRIQVDIGFGDAVTPGPVALEYPTLLHTVPAPDLIAYPIETVIAEKWEATVSLAEANSRLKDVIDLEHLARTESFDGGVVENAIRRTFERRKTPLDLNATVFTTAYRENDERQKLWAAARKRFKRTDGSERFADAMTFILKFIEPPFRAATGGRDFPGTWDEIERRWR
jgi:hypothetical protein